MDRSRPHYTIQGFIVDLTVEAKNPPNRFCTASDFCYIPRRIVKAVAKIRGGSSVGRALRSQCRGRGFNSLPLHSISLVHKRCGQGFFVKASPQPTFDCWTSQTGHGTIPSFSNHLAVPRRRLQEFSLTVPQVSDSLPNSSLRYLRAFLFKSLLFRFATIPPPRNLVSQFDQVRIPSFLPGEPCDVSPRILSPQASSRKGNEIANPNEHLRHSGGRGSTPSRLCFF